jgi:predicted transporter
MSLFLKRVLPPNPGRWFLRLLEIYFLIAAMLTWAYFMVIRALEGQIPFWEWPLLALVVIAFYHLRTNAPADQR